MSRYILQPSEQEGYFICTDTENGIVCKFKKLEFNETQEITILDDVKQPRPRKLARHMLDMGVWLRENHYLKILPMPSLRVWVGHNIKRIRKNRGLTQLELSEISGITQANIAKVEQGRYDIRIDTIEKLCHALGAQIDFIEND